MRFYIKNAGKVNSCQYPLLTFNNATTPQTNLKTNWNIPEQVRE